MKEKVHTMIDTELLDYPLKLGRAYEARHYLHGCAICEYFKDEFKEPQDIRFILTETAKEKKFNDICLQSTHCGPIIKKLLNGEYIANYDGGAGTDDIQIGVIGGEYVIFEGKHRVCMVKRFGLKKVPVVLSK